MPRIADRAQIRALLASDRAWSAYAMGDLAPAFFEHCDWHVAPNGTKGLVLVYRAFETPVLFALGQAAFVEPLLDEIENTPTLFLHIRPEVVPLLNARYEDCTTWAMWRMVINPLRYQPTPTQHAVRLGPADLERLQQLYSDGERTGESPDFFSPSMLSRGVYFGVYEGSDLVAAAGTHLVVPEEGVGAIGNVYTHREHRGRGHAATVTSAVTNELLRLNLPTIVLNVNQRNESAVRVYERLGYERYCTYYEGKAKHPLRGFNRRSSSEGPRL
jgi:ribosomal protein S18 acetylase RimI-like enzyme